MNAFIDYLLKSTLILSVLYSLYWMLMRRDTHFRFNRMVLLSILLISLLMPLINFDFLKRPEPLATLPSFTIDLDEAMVVNTVPQDGAKAIDWRNLILMVYGAGALIVLARLITQSIYLYAVSRLSKVIHAGKIKIVLMNADITPFAYFNRVYVPALKFRESSMEAILKHEQSHLEQLHYIDIFLIQVLTIMQWFNPFAWLFEKSLKETHEYLADEAVLQQGLDQGIYQALLVNEAVGGPVFTITNQFNKSLIKKRIVMMTKMKTPRLAQLKVFLFVPACAFFLLAFAAPERTIQPILEKGQEILSQGVSNPELIQADTSNIKKADSIIKRVPAKFPGGNDSLYIYIKKNLIFPPEARTKIISGIVLVKFDVAQDGKVKNAQVIRPLQNDCDDQALRVVSSMPNWIPASVNGKNVETTVTLPIYFNIPVNNNVQAITKKEVYAFVEKMPEFPGGMENYNKYLATNIRYPAIATEMGISGRVILQFIVSRTGAIENVKVLKGIGGGCDEEAVRVIKSMPKWNPGIQKGEPVDVYLTLPIAFSLKDSTKQNKISEMQFTRSEYPGGMQAFYTYINQNLKYPEEALQKKLSGIVLVRFYLNENGEAQNVRIEKGIGSGCDEEAIRLIKEMPRWKPATYNGNPVSTTMSVFVHFNLENKSDNKDFEKYYQELNK